MLLIGLCVEPGNYRVPEILQTVTDVLIIILLDSYYCFAPFSVA